MKVELPLRTSGGLNSREHWRARAKRVKSEREAVTWALVGKPKPAIPCLVTLTRIAPSAGLDPFDNLPSSLKGCVDAVAAWLGIDDRKSDLVRYQCRQCRGPWAVRIEFSGRPPGAD